MIDEFNIADFSLGREGPGFLNEEIYAAHDEFAYDHLGFDPLVPCIYIRYEDSNKYYIGSSFNIIRRYPYLDDLKRIKILQSFENGATKEELRIREQFYIDEYINKGYILTNVNKAYKEENWQDGKNIAHIKSGK